MAADDESRSDRDGAGRRDAGAPERASERMPAVLDASPMPTAITRLADDVILFANPACLELLGWKEGDVVGRTAVEVGFWAGPERRVAMLAQLAVEGVVRDQEEEIRTSSGETRIVETSISGVELDGEACLIGHLHDVTERRRLEARPRESDFLSRMGHELRTPLHAILGFGELLEGDDLRVAQREQLMQITKAGHHLLELINEVLELWRVERGELRLSLEPVHVGLIVSRTVQLLGPLAAARSVRLPVTPSEEHELHVRADRRRLEQVLLILLSNAVKYNRDGGEVRVGTARSGRGTARIEICDTGIGIAGEDLARAFAAFERLGAEATDVEGTGLGLALAKGLIEAMGGTIGVDSEVGRGTTFWLELPVVSVPTAQPSAPEHAPPTPGRRDPRSVLCVEDNASNIRLVEAILHARPEVTLLVAQRGSVALQLAREHRPALVLLDLNLPDMSGEEILRRLRGDPRTADVAIVILSADASPDQVARLRRAGADGYLTKPFEITQFLAVIDGLPAPSGPAEPALPPPRSRGAAPPSDPPLDFSLLDKLRGLYPDGTAVKDLVDVFLQDSRARLDALRTAAGDDDAQAVRSAAHAWRGSCSLTGAYRVAALLADIEDLASAGTIPDLQELAAVGRAYDEAHAALARQFP